ncbi:unnamed protein product, partial [Ectocarpus sp. 8 AP-2014]
ISSQRSFLFGLQTTQPLRSFFVMRTKKIRKSCPTSSTHHVASHLHTLSLSRTSMRFPAPPFFKWFDDPLRFTRHGGGTEEEQLTPLTPSLPSRKAQARMTYFVYTALASPA